jgi:hypothetical protein
MTPTKDQPADINPDVTANDPNAPTDEAVPEPMSDHDKINIMAVRMGWTDLVSD